jgi:hypothetical protein
MSSTESAKPVRLAAAPRWLIELICRGSTATGDSASSPADTDTDEIPAGRRHHELLREAGRLRWLGYDLVVIAAALHALNTHRCRPPLTAQEIDRLAADVVQRYPRGRTSSPPPVADREPVDDRTGDEESAASCVELPPWPVLAPEALHGLTGDLVRVIGPHTESDPVALLLQFLTAFGNVIGRTAYVPIEADRHYMNLFSVLVGDTSRGRKGTSAGYIRRLLLVADEDWVRFRILAGLSSGEGLIWAVRDAIRKMERQSGAKGQPARYVEIEIDPGVADKRAYIVEPEWGTTLRMLERHGNSLSGVSRQAWESGRLSTLVKHAAAVATDAHISITGHITRQELLRYLERTEVASGFANRHLFALVRRAQYLPRGGQVPEVMLASLSARITRAIRQARLYTEIGFTEPAWEVWEAVYPSLSAGKPGLLGAVISRAEAQTRRLAALYALLDEVMEVRPEHLLAGIAVWEYAEHSACFIFGDALGDPVADEILRALQGAGPNGLTRTELHGLFGRHRGTTDIGRALRVLLEHRLVTMSQDCSTGGRPAERWRATVFWNAKQAKKAQKAPGDTSLTSLISHLAIARAVVARQSGRDPDPGRS